MIISIIIGIVSVIFFMRLFGPCYDWGERILFLVLSIALGLVMFVELMLGAAVFCSNLSTVYTLQSSSPIVALKDDQITQGHFFLGGGTVNGEMYYYYAENTYRGYVVKHVDADDCFLLFDDEKPRIECYKADRFKNKLHYIYAWPHGYYYKIYIPHGSITTEFKVDLE